jgi:hypothetical protein
MGDISRDEAMMLTYEMRSRGFRGTGDGFFGRAELPQEGVQARIQNSSSDASGSA